MEAMGSTSTKIRAAGPPSSSLATRCDPSSFVLDMIDDVRSMAPHVLTHRLIARDYGTDAPSQAVRDALSS